MTVDEIEQKIKELTEDPELVQVSTAIEQDAHMEFINSLKEMVNKY